MVKVLALTIPERDTLEGVCNGAQAAKPSRRRLPASDIKPFQGFRYGDGTEQLTAICGSGCTGRGAANPLSHLHANGSASSMSAKK